ncbi:diacylglycerol kinase family protein [Sporosarcina obsidiansis]|uniref:hypothetical protein n=1 Tax=Sporosarcina obsidiansis TaxID=2660748 RepID=UPI001890FD38|nr:hypothetical protein [Sporosarcina obsidiansis]
MNGIVGFEHVTIGVVKAGSGNEFTREFKAFTDLAEIESYAARVPLLRRAIDLGSVQLTNEISSFFASNCGFGLDAEISLAVSWSRVKKILINGKKGNLVYGITIVHSISLLKFMTVFNGSHTRFKGVSTYRSEKFLISTDQEGGCHMDGECIGTTRVGQPVVCEGDSRKWNVVGLE